MSAIEGLKILVIFAAAFLFSIFILDRFYRELIKREIDEIRKQYSVHLEKLRKENGVGRL
jgi:hypothetical protein